MLLKDLTIVYISEYQEIDNYGEPEKVWKYKGIAYLNLQQDVNELDRKSTGEVDYSIYKGRTDKNYDLYKGNGISFDDISTQTDIKPDYKVLDKNKIGNIYTYRLEKIQ